MMCSTDFDPADIWEVTTQRARKRHDCTECGRSIIPGEDYARANWLADGSWGHATRCSGCYFLCQAIETLECGDHGGLILWGGGGPEDEIEELGHGSYSEERDEYEPHWAAVAFEAIKGYRPTQTETA